MLMPYQNNRTPLTSRYTLFYSLRVIQRRFFRWIRWLFGSEKYAKEKQKSKLEFRCFKHSSKLIKPLEGIEMTWQINKITNLKLAIEKINGIIIQPGETFSFCKLVGRPTAAKGYLEGMELAAGEARAGIGGGICQISNLIHWLTLHSPLIIKERSNHSFDPFPDVERILPFGSGAAIFYNFIDLMLFNPTSMCFQINLWLTDKLLEGEIRCNEKINVKYHIYEKNHQFLEFKNQHYRQNEIWRDIILKETENDILRSELIYKNFARLKYKINLTSQ